MNGYRVPSMYDSLIAKIITWGDDRSQALARMRRALGETLIEGFPTTIPFQLRVMSEPEFVSGRFDTSFVSRLPARGQAGSPETVPSR